MPSRMAEHTVLNRTNTNTIPMATSSMVDPSILHRSRCLNSHARPGWRYCATPRSAVHSRKCRSPVYSKGMIVIHLIDGTYELFRHFYGLRRFSKGQDRPFGAVNGVLHTVLELVEQGATHVGVATDH